MPSSVLFGVFAHSKEAAAELAIKPHETLPTTFPKILADWWIEPRGYCALFSPTKNKVDRVTKSIIAGNSQGSKNPTDYFQLATTHADAKSLKGKFSLAFWNPKTRCLTLARDHLGQAQIYLRRSERYTFFSSDLRSILNDQSFTPSLDQFTAYKYLLSGVVPSPATLTREVTQLPAAHTLQWSPFGAPLLARYWTPLNPELDHIDESELTTKIEQELKQAVTSNLAPKRNALLLSGGLDSSLLACLSQSHNKLEPLTAYTIDFRPVSKNSEVKYARIAAEAFGLPLIEVPLTAGNAVPLLNEVLMSPIPCSAWSTITHRALMASAASHGDHRILSGLGSDEIFGNYDRYLFFYKRQRNYARRNRKELWLNDLLNSRRSAIRNLFPGVAEFFTLQRLKVITSREVSTDISGEMIQFYRSALQMKPTAHIFELMVSHECHHRIPDLLLPGFVEAGYGTDTDVNYPFLATPLVTLANALGPSMRFWHDGQKWRGKKWLREYAENLLPQKLLHRPVCSYNAPILDWLLHKRFRETVLERIAETKLWETGLLHKSLRKALLRDLSRLNKPVMASHRWTEELWVVLTLGAWFDRYIARTNM